MAFVADGIQKTSSAVLKNVSKLNVYFSSVNHLFPRQLPVANIRVVFGGQTSPPSKFMFGTTQREKN